MRYRYFQLKFCFQIRTHTPLPHFSLRFTISSKLSFLEPELENTKDKSLLSATAAFSRNQRVERVFLRSFAASSTRGYLWFYLGASDGCRPGRLLFDLRLIGKSYGPRRDTGGKEQRKEKERENTNSCSPPFSPPSAKQKSRVLGGVHN